MIDLLRAIEPAAWITPVEKAIDQLQSVDVGYVTLMRSLMTERDKLPLAVKVGQHGLALNAEEGLRVHIRSYLILALIGLGRFEMAIETVTDAPEADWRADDYFNLAVAKWGRDRQPPVELFQQVIDLAEDEELRSDANLYQCIALAEMVVGDTGAASDSIEYARSRARTGERAFSCWRYLEVSGREMLNDLSAMANALGVNPIPEPEFFPEVRRLVH